jgi:phosphotriesterase-related protein
MKGKVQTVLGDIDPADLGNTTMHEHLFIDFTVVFQAPAEATAKAKAYEPVSMKNLGRVRYNPFGSYTNLQLLDEDLAIEEVSHFKRVGGGTIVDVTTVGIGRDPIALSNISRATGANIVMGAGYYIAPSHPAGMDDKTVDDLAEEMIADMTTGVGNTGIKTGLIGELGCGWPLHDNERKVLVAAAHAQKETGASILVHPGRDEAATFEVLDIIAGAGGDINRVVMGHIGRTFTDVERVIELAKTGCYLEYDQFGWESSYFSYGVMDFPNDAQRMDHIQRLIDAGYGDKVVIGQDICGKHHLVKYGGWGYGHIVEHIIPRLRDRGVTEDQIAAIYTGNPAAVLTLV